jgi:hypothetical protein
VVVYRVIYIVKLASTEKSGYAGRDNLSLRLHKRNSEHIVVGIEDSVVCFFTGITIIRNSSENIEDEEEIYNK